MGISNVLWPNGLEVVAPVECNRSLGTRYRGLGGSVHRALVASPEDQTFTE
jgi:hypothetical protein